jgi:DNA repair protein RecN (Recombination protein N)
MPRAELVELSAHALGVIEDALIEFSPGFTVFTGETGAGKTLLVGALELSLGIDGGTSRHAIGDGTRTALLLRNLNGDELVLARETTESGRLRSVLNGAVSSAEMLRTASSGLVSLHGQHDSHSLKTRAEVLRIVDASGGVDTSNLDKLRDLLSDKISDREKLGGDASHRDHEKALMQFQLNEIQEANILSEDELNSVLSELERLTGIIDNQKVLSDVCEGLDGDGDSAVLPRLAGLESRLPDLQSFRDAKLLLQSAVREAREAVRELSGLLEPEPASVDELQKLERRAIELQNLARKYGGSLASVVNLRDSIRDELSKIDGDDEYLRQLDMQIEDLQSQVIEVEKLIRAERVEAAEELTEAIQLQLPRVALGGASLRILIDGNDGSMAQILFRPNPGQPEGSLQELASGGELSRVLLAIALETVAVESVAIFDEIDAGLGGQVAQQIGDCLHELSTRQQVVAITHLASVASRADRHFVVDKRSEAGRTVTCVREVIGDDRVRELARMLAGDENSPESRALATKLLTRSN